MVRHFDLHEVISHADKVSERHFPPPTPPTLPRCLQFHWRAAERKCHGRAVTTVGTLSMTTTSRSCRNTVKINEYPGKKTEIYCLSNYNMNQYTNP